ncbi:hypothetical protein ACFFHM_17735 [Halalkalibacter kiskunsagensis]|uniref:Lipoprotein n=1 Tax=Halalkalibacter kiskunsagensis TaxID=1548599 RepID=A0ABV6KG32_9BACI
MKKIILVGFIAVIIISLVGCWDNGKKLDTSLLRSIGENSYIFPAYEVILREMPFKTQLPTYIPIKGAMASKTWETSSIITNDNLEEVLVELSLETILTEDVPEILLVVAANYKDESWDYVNLGREVELDSETIGNFYYLRDSEDNHVELRFNKDGVYYIIIYYSYVETKEEKEKELIKIANSLVDYDRWYDEKYIEPGLEPPTIND